MIIDDAPPSSLIDSTTSPKVKTTKGQEIGACSLTRNTSKVEGHVGTPRWGLGQVTNGSIICMDLHKQTNWLVHSHSIFGARTNQEQT